MKKNYVLKTLLIFFISIFLVYSGFLTGSMKGTKKHPPSPSYPIEKTVYIETPQSRFSNAIRIEVEVMDDVAKPNGQVLSVQFAGKQIPLKPVDPTGRRGSAFLQLLPGNYPIQWDVKNSSASFPPTLHFEKNVSVQANDIGTYVLIKGDQLFVEHENP
jgi:hypothetical protein